ncbi:MAG TPA: phosphoribosyltransferase [Burkholderiales bacterium]|nr:phosphoribosyltransferase [Burkholderiales bacterium]
MTRFPNRSEAGRALGAELSRRYPGNGAEALVLALPRGGVPVGYEVARALGIRLDVFVVRKLGVPGHEELAMGAIASGGVRVLNEDVISMAGVSPDQIERVTQREEQELQRREQSYRGAGEPIDVAGKRVFLVDDGLATGSTMRAAVRALRAMHAGEVMVAVPVAAPETCEQLREEADDVVCLLTPAAFYAVGLWYEDFSQTSDEEVKALLQRARSGGAAPFQ